jgi:hypothetical protein
MSMGSQSVESLLLVEVEPGVNGVRITWFEQTGLGEGMRRLAVSDFEQGGTSFAEIGSAVVITGVEKFLALI